MRSLQPVPIERNSIYGDTYDGVPTPNTLIIHGYPTRFHGPVFTVPRLGHQNIRYPYARAPFLGTGALGDESSLSAAISSRWFDAVMGAAVGYVLSPDGSSALPYAVGGAAYGGVLGKTAIALAIGVAALVKLTGTQLPKVALKRT